MEEYTTSKTVKTEVDELIELLKKKEKVSLSDMAKELNISKTLLQKWVDFLVEEKIIGIEYKFTTPYIYLTKEKAVPEFNFQEDEEIESEELSLADFKNEFMDKIPEGLSEKSKTLDKESLWKNHLWEVLKKKANFFINEANKRGLKNHNELWEEYKLSIFSGEE
ncbi:hypothetical protein JXB41_04550 [Candidatus Woesearchaeota archaeon]|nr:hypothetical protein [Candidatus Woesearchaeota archaeon]